MKYLLVTTEDDGYTYSSSNVTEFEEDEYSKLEEELDKELKDGSVHEYFIYKAELIRFGARYEVL